MALGPEADHFRRFGCRPMKLVPRGAEASDKAADRGGAASGILWGACRSQ
jgi:hypothetical protein